MELLDLNSFLSTRHIKHSDIKITENLSDCVLSYTDTSKFSVSDKVRKG